MPEFDSVILRTIYIFVSNEDEAHLMEPIRHIGHPVPTFIANPSQGISFRGEASIPFGASVQDVISILGRPSFLSYKNQNVLTIHSPQKTDNPAQPDYFYNFFNLGLDVLFDAVSHTAKKFILRANFPTNTLFDLYRKCQFQL